MEQQKLIDIHCHTAGIGAGGSGCLVAAGLRGSWKYHIYLRSFGVSEKELLERGDGLVLERLSDLLSDSAQVGQAVILALDGVVSAGGELDLARTEVYIPNEFVAAEIRRHRNLLYGASVNPFRADALERLELAVADGAVLLKWLPSIQHIDPADQRLIPFYRRLRELELPLLTHTGAESSFSRADNSLGDPARLRLPLEEGVTVIAAHAATNGRSEGMSNFARILPLFAEFPNLYADISSLTQINKLGHLARLLRHVEIHEQLLYGTDMPLLTTGIVSPFFFPLNLSLGKMLELQRITNPWDRDVALKRALGVPEQVFTTANRLLRLKQEHPSQPAEH